MPKSIEEGKDPLKSPFNKHILSLPDNEIVWLLPPTDSLKEVNTKIPYLNQIVSGYSEFIVFVNPISNWNLFLIDQ